MFTEKRVFNLFYQCDQCDTMVETLLEAFAHKRGRHTRTVDIQCELLTDDMKSGRASVGDADSLPKSTLKRDLPPASNKATKRVRFQLPLPRHKKCLGVRLLKKSVVEKSCQERMTTPPPRILSHEGYEYRYRQMRGNKRLQYECRERRTGNCRALLKVHIDSGDVKTGFVGHTHAPHHPHKGALSFVSPPLRVSLVTVPHLESDLTIPNASLFSPQSLEEPAIGDTDHKPILEQSDSEDCALVFDSGTNVDAINVANVSKRGNDVANALSDGDVEEVESSIALSSAEQPKRKERVPRRTIEKRKIA